MYFRSSSRYNPETQKSEGYYRIIESYRNEYGRVCHRTLYNAGFIKFDAEKLITIQRILNNKLNRRDSLFEETDKEAMFIADRSVLV